LNFPKLITGFWGNYTFKFAHKRGSVLIINDGALGDYIHGLPFAYCLKNLGYEVTILSSDKNKLDDTFQVIPYYDIINDKRFKMIFVMNYKKPVFFKLWRANAYFFNFRRAALRAFRRWEEKHWSDFYLECLSDFVKKSIFFNNGNRVEKEKYVVFHPGSSMKEKNWDIEKFIEVYKGIDYEHKLFVLGPSDTHLKDVLDKNGCKYMVSTDFKALEKIAKETYLFVGSDSGVAHYFATFNTNVISIFTIGCGPTHFPYTRRGTFYFEEEVFKRFYKKGEITQIKLNPEALLRQIYHIIQKDNKVEPGFFKSANYAHYLI